ncbi:MAG: type IV pilus modification protein PilV [Pseudomonadales bacterium]|nr:type IV pilus modification protein PilV [Pseudomonadales bacterium]
MTSNRMPSNNKGFSLIEVLVTLIIVSIGIMGLISMQLISAKNVNNAELRSLASYYVYDMVERMRANPAAVAAGSYNNVNGSETDPGTDCSGGCSFAILAQYDAFIWNDMIDNSFANNSPSTPNSPTSARGLGPGAAGEVSLAAGIYTVAVTWKEQDRNNAGGNITDQTLSIEFQL